MHQHWRCHSLAQSRRCDMFHSIHTYNPYDEGRFYNETSTLSVCMYTNYKHNWTADLYCGNRSRKSPVGHSHRAQIRLKSLWTCQVPQNFTKFHWLFLMKLSDHFKVIRNHYGQIILEENRSNFVPVDLQAHMSGSGIHIRTGAWITLKFCEAKRRITMVLSANCGMSPSNHCWN